MEKKIDIKETLSYAWEIFKANPVQHILVMIAFAIISQVTSVLIESLAGSDMMLLSTLNLLDFLTISALTSMFLFSYSILQTRKSDKDLKDIISSVFDFDLWWKYVVATVLSTLAVLIGLLLLVVPGVIVALGLMFAAYFVIDYKDNPIDALKRSWEITKGYKWTLLLLVVILTVLNILGFLALIVGLFVTMPVSMFAVAHVYNILTDAYEEQDNGQEDTDSGNEKEDDETDEEQETNGSDDKNDEFESDEEVEQQ